MHKDPPLQKSTGNIGDPHHDQGPHRCEAQFLALDIQRRVQKEMFDLD